VKIYTDEMGTQWNVKVVPWRVRLSCRDETVDIRGRVLPDLVLDDETEVSMDLVIAAMRLAGYEVSGPAKRCAKCQAVIHDPELADAEPERCEWCADA
jgi:hypothetical protein